WDSANSSPHLSAFFTPNPSCLKRSAPQEVHFYHPVSDILFLVVGPTYGLMSGGKRAYIEFSFEIETSCNGAQRQPAAWRNEALQLSIFHYPGILRRDWVRVADLVTMGV